MIYDIIGDIHGQADKLTALLAKLGYQLTDKSYQHPNGNKVIFVGDFVDRGPKQLDTLAIVFAMLDNGHYGIMGNHEYNAIAYATPCPDGGFYRKHTAKNKEQHQAFLDATGGIDTDIHAHWIKRFYELPLWLELDELRVIHACYDTDAIKTIKPYLTDGRLTPQSLKTIHHNENAQTALEILLKGMEIHVKDPHFLIDGSGNKRQNLRLAWWNAPLSGLPLDRLSAASQCDLTHIGEGVASDSVFDYPKDKPIFIGHYWMNDTPALLTDKVACVDYSAGKGGPLVAYRFDTQHPTLSNQHFVY